MDTFSKSSGVQGGGNRTKAPSQNINNNSNKKRMTGGRIIARLICFIIFVGASIKRMIKDKSSYIQSAKGNDRTSNASVGGSAVAIQQPPVIQTTRTAPDVKATFASWTKPYWNQTFDNNNNNNNSTTFVFPSVNVRLRYYMGSWYNQTLVTVDCNDAFKPRFINRKFDSGMHDQDVLYSFPYLTQEVLTSEHWNAHNYLKFYHRVLQNSSVPKNAVVAMCVGDSSSVKTHLPVAAKTRKAGLDDPTSPNTHFGIIWPLNMVRHFGPVLDYLLLEEAGNVAAWEDKQEALIWRGGYTGVPFLLKGDGYRKSFHQYGPRVQAVVANCFHNTSEIDVAFINIPPTRNGIPRSLNKTLMENCVRDSHTSMQAQLEYKYILNVEGNDVSSGLKWQLASNSVVFMAKPMTVSWAMEDQLVPFYHYIPVDDNYENFPEMMDWAKTHDDQARKIAVQSTQFMYDLWISEQAQREFAELHTLLATTYESQFGSALSKCLKVAPSHNRQVKGLPRGWNHLRSSTWLKAGKTNRPYKKTRTKQKKKKVKRKHWWW